MHKVVLYAYFGKIVLISGGEIMYNGSYELHTYINENIPIIYHRRTIIGEWEYYMHWHENIEILFITEGVLEIRLDDTTYYAETNDTVIINSSVMHDLAAADGSVEYDCLIIDKSFCEQYGFYIDETHIEEIVNEYTLCDINNRIKYLWTEKPAYYEADVAACLLNILTVLFRNHISKKENYNKNKNIEMVKKGIKWIGKHFKEEIGVDEVSENVGYSKYYFSRCFKEVTCSTVNEYINRVRINYACKKLREDGVSVGDVSAMCGFADISYFTKVFKKYTGVLPSRIEKN